PARLLTRARDSARITHQEGSVEAADVDSQLQGVGACDAQELPFKQLAFDLSPLGRQVPSPVCPNGPSEAWVTPLEVLPDVAVKELRDDPRPGKGNGLHSFRNELHHDLPGFGVGAAALRRLADPRRVPQDEMLFPAGGAVVVDVGAREA